MIRRHASGLYVITEKNDSPIISCRLKIKVGSSNETSEERGLSHFLEHMVFNGTTTKTKENILYDIPALGASQNAYTSVEETVYIIDGLESNFKECLDVLCDMVLNPAFPKESITKEQNVVLAELNDSENDPGDAAYNSFFSNLFTTDEIKTPILGPAENIKNFNQEILFNYHKKHYRPDNMILSVSGNFNDEILEELISKYFDNLGSNVSDIKDTTVFEFTSPEVIKEPNKFYSDYVLGSYPVENINDVFVVELINKILGSGMSSLLFKKIREELGLVYHISSHYTKIRNNELIYVLAMCNPENTDKIIDLFPKVAKEIVNISEDDFNGGKNRYLYSVTNTFSDTKSTALRNIHTYEEFGRCLSYDDYKNSINSITFDRFKEVASKIFSQTPLIVASVSEAKSEE